jgi:EAL and modified HD-GYP domain-containing signal transduction protein
VSSKPALSSEPDQYEIFISRQPIYDQKLNAVAYELFFQDLTSAPEQLDDDDATTEVLISSLIEIGLPNIAENKPAFISLSPKYINGELPFALGQQNVVLQVPERYAGDANAMSVLNALHQQHGLPLALEDFTFDETNSDLASSADFVKLDINHFSDEDIARQIRLIKASGVKLIAEKIATQADFQRCKQHGFDYYQGRFFCEPNVIRGQRTPSSRLAIMHLLAELQNPDVSFEHLENLITKDVSLSYRILRYINSARYNLRREINSIHQAITILGLRTIKTWVTIIAQSRFDDKPYELMITSLIRARMCELLAEAQQLKHESVFVVGLFSTLDALLDKPMDEVLEELPLTEEVNDAILNHAGPLGQVLQCVIAYEQGDWDRIPDLNLDNQTLKNAYLDSIQWTREVGQEILAQA